MKAIWIASLGIALLAGSAAGASTSGSVDLVAYSTPKDAYGKIIAAFQKTKAGTGTSVSQSYGPPETRHVPSPPACTPTSSHCRSTRT